MKSDESVRRIVVASIRRHSRDRESWLQTRLWDGASPAGQSTIAEACRLESGEWPIVSSFIDVATWTFVTTRRIWSCDDGRVESVARADVTRVEWGNFKGNGPPGVERARVHRLSATPMTCPYETGFPSMAIVYGIRTLVQLR